jgi:hypothetical protein
MISMPWRRAAAVRWGAATTWLTATVTQARKRQTTPAGWLLGKSRLLDYIELRRGRYARNEAQTRANKYSDIWSQPPQLVLKKRRSGG